jgi:hypothetical protein
LYSKHRSIGQLLNELQLWLRENKASKRIVFQVLGIDEIAGRFEIDRLLFAQGSTNVEFEAKSMFLENCVNSDFDFVFDTYLQQIAANLAISERELKPREKSRQHDREAELGEYSEECNEHVPAREVSVSEVELDAIARAAEQFSCADRANEFPREIAVPGAMLALRESSARVHQRVPFEFRVEQQQLGIARELVELSRQSYNHEYLHYAARIALLETELRAFKRKRDTMSPRQRELLNELRVKIDEQIQAIEEPSSENSALDGGYWSTPSGRRKSRN